MKAVSFLLFIGAVFMVAVGFISSFSYEYSESLAHSHCNAEIKGFFNKSLNGTHWVCESVNGGQRTVYGLTPSDLEFGGVFS